MKFGEGVVDNKARPTTTGIKRKKKEYVLIYNKSMWCIKYNNYLVEIEELPTLEGCTKMYSLPTNTYYEKDWTKSRETKPISKTRAKELKTLWSRYKPNDLIIPQFTRFKII